MANIYQFNESEFLAFFLVLMRISAFLVSWPVLGSEVVPASAKILFSLVVSIVIFPTVNWSNLDVNLGSFQTILMAGSEVFAGLCLGFLSRAFFFVLSMAGEIISVSMGLSSAQLFNPAMSDRASSLDQFFVGLGILFFLAINGHHLLLDALNQSFNVIALGAPHLSFNYFESLGHVLQELTVIGLKLSSPILVAIMFMNMAMAVVGRAVPQINVLVSSLPINILMGFLVIFISLPLIIWQMPELLHSTTERLFQLVKTF